MKLFILVAALISCSNGVSLFGRSSCEDKKSIFNSRPNLCAVVYDQDNCGGESKEIEVEYLEFDRNLKNDVESLMVRPGCALIGYSNDRGRSGLFEGENAVFDALSRRSSEGPLINDNLDNDELDEDMESVDCYCSSTRGIGNVQKISNSEIEGHGFFDSILGRNRASKCNEQVAIFNRPGVQPKAMVYDEPGCHGRMREIGEGYTELSHTIRQDLDNDIESVIVRPGCTFVGTDHEKGLRGRGGSVTIDARRSSGEPKAKNLSGSGDLEEDISAIDVTC